MLKTIDLFSGAGGLSLGFQQTGEFQIIAAAEINKAARETYKANIASNVTNFVFINDIKGYDFSTLSGQVGGIDIVIGVPMSGLRLTVRIITGRRCWLLEQGSSLLF